MPQAIISIRAAGSDDAGVVAAIGASSFRDAYAPHSEPLDLEAHIEEFFTAAAIRAELQRCDYLLATVDATPAGIAKYRSAACPAAGGASDALELQQLYVLASLQRHGLGRRLVDALLAIAKRQGKSGIWLTAWQQADWALNFYRKLGFVKVGTTDFTLGATSYIDDLLWLALPAAGRRTPGRSQS